jgi:hypothetical protein
MKRRNTNTGLRQAYSTASFRCGNGGNMVIPQPHRQIVNIDSAISRNQNAN